MKIKDTIKRCIKHFQDKRFILGHRKIELRKSLEEKRVKLYEGVNLSDTQKKMIDDLYESCYGEKIPYNWHRIYMSYTGNFDKYYFPEYLYIPEFEHFMIPDKEYATVMETEILPTKVGRLFYD